MPRLARLSPPVAARVVAAIAPALLLAGCGGTASVGVAPLPAPPRAVRHPALPPAHMLTMPGLEGVIGAEPNQLIRQFGTPRLDEMEGDSRKLQFAGTPCVLDVYLYPPASGANPRATYVEARRATDAREVDRAACIAALRKGADQR